MNDAKPPEKPPVPWVTHYQLQAAFAKVAEALKVPIRTGDDFEPIAAQCVERARAMTPHADKAQAALALVDGARDALDYVEALPGKTSDLLRAKATLDRALPLLGEMAGKEANHE